MEATVSGGGRQRGRAVFFLGGSSIIYECRNSRDVLSLVSVFLCVLLI